MESQQIDRLSSLPRELLDTIFVLAASDQKLSIVPPSKRLSPSHTRALYRRLDIGNWKQLVQVASALKANADRGSYVKRVVWKRDDLGHYLRDHRIPLVDIGRRIPAVEEMVFRRGTDYVARIMSVTSLRVCQFSGCYLTSTIVEWLAQNPNLRRVKLTHVRLRMEEEGNDEEETDEEETDDEEEPAETTSAPQVKEVVLNVADHTAHLPARLARVLRFFPSATVVEFTHCMFETSDKLELITILERVAPDVRTLRLYSSEQESDHRIDHLLSQFARLEHLHLDSSMFSNNLHEQLPYLPHLVSLSLTFFQFQLPPYDLFTLLQRLPCFKTVKMEYCKTWEGVRLDMAEAVGILNPSNPDLDPKDEIHDLLQPSNLYDMEMDGWYSPFNADTPDEVLGLIESEKRIRDSGIEVQSNIEEVLQALHRQIIELYNRGIARIYFYDDSELLRFVRNLARQYNFQLPSLEIDLDNPAGFSRETLEWYQVDMTDVIGGKGREYIGLGLRSRNGGETERSEKER